MIHIPPWAIENVTPDEWETIKRANAIERREEARMVNCAKCGKLCEPSDYCGRPHCVSCRRFEEEFDEDYS